MVLNSYQQGREDAGKIFNLEVICSQFVGQKIHCLKQANCGSDSYASVIREAGIVI
jgi:hypothetical protein